MENIGHISALPMLGNETIHIWGVHVPDVLDELEAMKSILSAEERQKAAEAGVFKTVCPEFVKDAAQIIQDMLGE